MMARDRSRRPGNIPPTGFPDLEKGVDYRMYLAYLDPGSGSMLAAAIVAGFAGIAVTVRVWWRRLRGKSRPLPEPVAEPARTPEQEG